MPEIKPNGTYDDQRQTRSRTEMENNWPAICAKLESGMVSKTVWKQFSQQGLIGCSYATFMRFVEHKRLMNLKKGNVLCHQIVAHGLGYDSFQDYWDDYCNRRLKVQPDDENKILAFSDAKSLSSSDNPMHSFGFDFQALYEYLNLKELDSKTYWSNRQKIANQILYRNANKAVIEQMEGVWNDIENPDHFIELRNDELCIDAYKRFKLEWHIGKPTDIYAEIDDIVLSLCLDGNRLTMKTFANRQAYLNNNSSRTFSLERAENDNRAKYQDLCNTVADAHLKPLPPETIDEICGVYTVNASDVIYDFNVCCSSSIITPLTTLQSVYCSNPGTKTLFQSYIEEIMSGAIYTTDKGGYFLVSYPKFMLGSTSTYTVLRKIEIKAIDIKHNKIILGSSFPTYFSQNTLIKKGTLTQKIFNLLSNVENHIADWLDSFGRKILSL